MRWNEGLCLGADRCKHALLGEPLAVGAASVFGLIKTRASDLQVHVNTARHICAYSRRIPCACDNIYMRLQSFGVVLADLVDSPSAVAVDTAVGTFVVEQAARDIGLGAEAEVSA